jgi:nitrogen PTS system EIIA component
MNLTSILTEDMVYLDIPCQTQQDLLEWVSNCLSQVTKQTCDTIHRAFLYREALGSTALGQGIALPHARIELINTFHIMFVRTKQPIFYHAPDDLPVFLFFILLVPGDADELHLQILSEIIQLVANSSIRDSLQNAHSIHDVMRILGESS